MSNKTEIIQVPVFKYAIKYGSEDYKQKKEEWKKEIKKFRTKLREKILTAKLIDESNPVEFMTWFSGYGDNGQIDDVEGNDTFPELFDFFNLMLNTEVQFDWYNNDGGGGDMKWDVIKDVVTINGYQNETIQNTIMNNEKF